MSSANMRGAVKAYRKVGVESRVNEAPPQQRVKMLFDGLLEWIVVARAALQRGDLPTKATRITRAHRLVTALQAGLDYETGGELVANLEALYDYIGRRLTEANAFDSDEILAEVESLVRELKAGWDAIAGMPPSSTQAAPAQQQAAR